MNTESKLDLSKLFTADNKNSNNYKNKSNIISKNSKSLLKNSKTLLKNSKTLLKKSKIPSNKVESSNNISFNNNDSQLFNTNIKPISSVESNNTNNLVSNNISSNKSSIIKNNHNILNPAKIILLILIFILFLSILGFNLFGYIGEKIDFFNNNLNPLNNIINKYFFNTSKAIINNSSKGSEIILDKSKNQVDKIKEKTQLKKNKKNKNKDKIEPTDSDSNNFCYIGKHKGIRYCEKMGENNKQCVSNSIYPTMDQCINNNLK